MGETFAIISMSLFSMANIAIIRGFDGKTRSAGAFLSILITFGLSLSIWVGAGLHNGRSFMESVEGSAIAWFALAGVLTMFIGRVFLYASIQHLGAFRASAIKRLNPFFSVLLGVLLLGESVNGRLLAGMALICASFYVLVRQTLAADAPAGQEGAGQTALGRLRNLGYFYGPVSALAYASGYVARKEGLSIVPDAALGTMVGALTGIIVYVIASAFITSYRNDVRQTFSVLNSWLLLAGIFSSFGQICYFVALSYSTISKIALITSMEVFTTMFFSTVVFRSKEKLTADVVVAGCLGVLGTVLVILD